MAQLSGFTKAFNMSMNNMLTFAQMRQQQQQREALLKQKKEEQTIDNAFKIMSASSQLFDKKYGKETNQWAANSWGKAYGTITGNPNIKVPTFRTDSKAFQSLGKDLASMQSDIAKLEDPLARRKQIMEMRGIFRKRIAQARSEYGAEQEQLDSLETRTKTGLDSLEKSTNTQISEATTAGKQLLDRQQKEKEFELKQQESVRKQEAHEVDMAKKWAAKDIEGKDKDKDKPAITWQNATNNLSKRFFAQDKIGNIIITKEAQGMHRIAQKKLDELRLSGVDSLTAVNASEDFARKNEEGYWLLITQAEEIEDKKVRKAQIRKIQDGFRIKFNYTPSRRPRN